MFDSDEFDGKVVVVTGGSQGIGLEIGRQYSKLGATVILVARNSAKLEAAKSTFGTGANLSIYACDLSVVTEIEHLFSEIESKFPKVDILVNNMGAFSEKIGWDEIDHELWINAFDTNTLAAYFCMVKASAIMIKNGIKGAIINVGSSTALQLKKGRLHYTVTKSAIHTLSRVTALDLAKHQIRVNVVSPGPTATEVVQKRMDDPSQSGQEEERLKKIPLGRYAKPADIANAVVFLSSSSAQYITGAILPVDGGYTIGETI